MALRVINRVRNIASLDHAKCSPRSLAAGCVFMATRMLGVSRPPEWMSRFIDVSDVDIFEV